jgi:hypothetical protein
MKVEGFELLSICFLCQGTFKLLNVCALDCCGPVASVNGYLIGDQPMVNPVLTSNCT